MSESNSYKNDEFKFAGYIAGFETWQNEEKKFSNLTENFQRPEGIKDFTNFKIELFNNDNREIEKDHSKAIPKFDDIFQQFQYIRENSGRGGNWNEEEKEEIKSFKTNNNASFSPIQEQSRFTNSKKETNQDQVKDLLKYFQNSEELAMKRVNNSNIIEKETYPNTMKNSKKYGNQPLQNLSQQDEIISRTNFENAKDTFQIYSSTQNYQNSKVENEIRTNILQREVLFDLEKCR